jgi:hypothetical protein
MENLMAHRHARRLNFRPQGRLRWTLAIFGLLAIATSWTGPHPRYDHVIKEALAITMFLAGVLPAELRAKVRVGVYGLATFFIGMAGMIAGTSPSESFSLMTGAVFAAALSLAFGRPHERARHAAV